MIEAKKREPCPNSCQREINISSKQDIGVIIAGFRDGNKNPNSMEVHMTSQRNDTGERLMRHFEELGIGAMLV